MSDKHIPMPRTIVVGAKRFRVIWSRERMFFCDHDAGETERREVPGCLSDTDRTITVARCMPRTQATAVRLHREAAEGETGYEVVYTVELLATFGHVCRIDHDASQIQIDAGVPDAERPAVINNAVVQVLAKQPKLSFSTSTFETWKTADRRHYFVCRSCRATYWRIDAMRRHLLKAHGLDIGQGDGNDEGRAAA